MPAYHTKKLTTNNNYALLYRIHASTNVKSESCIDTFSDYVCCAHLCYSAIRSSNFLFSVNTGAVLLNSKYEEPKQKIYYM